MNKNYVKGRKKEYKIKRQLEMQGWLVLRSAGSHGFADLIAVKEDKVRFIQCKPEEFRESERKKLEEEWKFLNGLKLIASYEVI